MLEPVTKPVVVKQGKLSKLGGGGGGHKNWRDRWFVLSDHLYYYDNEANYKKGKDYLGVIALNAYYCGVDTNTDTKHGFQVLAYPKSLVCRASSDADRDAWIDAIMAPIKALEKEDAGTADKPAAAAAAAESS